MTVGQTPRKWLGTKEAAAYLGVSVTWLWRHKPQGPPSYLLAGTHRYRISDLETWIEQQRGKRRDSR